MKRALLISFLLLCILYSCQLNEKNEYSYEKKVLSKYLQQNFDITIDSLTTKVVLITYIGCRPCIDKYLEFFNQQNKNKEAFLLILPRKGKNQFLDEDKIKQKEIFSTEGELNILVDSLNMMMKQDLSINGLSVYNIVEGEILEIKTIDIDKTSRADMSAFWFDWD